MTTNSSSPQPVDAVSFEQQLAALEVIVLELEEGQIGLADALARYEQGIKLLKQCYQTLEGAERRIELLSRVTADGTPVTQPLDDASESLEEKSQRRSQRRSRAATDSQAALESPAAPPTAAAPSKPEGEIDVPGGLF